MTEFKRGQSVYDSAGYEYIYEQELNTGHLVAKLVCVQTTSYRGDDYDEEFIEGELITLNNVYSKPPKPKMVDEIISLNDNIKLLKEEKRKIKNKISELKLNATKHKADLEHEIKKYPMHRMLLNVLNQNQTFYFISDFDSDFLSIHHTNTCEVSFKIEKEKIYIKSQLTWHDDYYEGIGFSTIEEAELELISLIEKMKEIPLRAAKKYQELFMKHKRVPTSLIMNAIHAYDERESKRKIQKIRRLKAQIEQNSKELDELL